MRQCKTLITFFLVITSLSVFADSSKDDSSQPEKTKLSSQIFEADDKEDKKSFSAKVKMIREMGDIEVFFEGKDKGPFMLPESSSLGLYKERLIKSQKSKNQNVKVKIEKDNITSVELDEATQNKTPKENVDSVIDSMLKK
ncbi:MAG: hypothetical protein L6Q37_05550 [Bdellovibrionaceae bacterium]|nr:hypothetical protein [Pseudobdellovibrionaceae bacterium]NUM59789.1 hypothetical protein [Pseudobdellovibrionaceae bacterium]